MENATDAFTNHILTDEEKKQNNFRAFYEGDVFIGFVNILEEETEVFIGIGENLERKGSSVLLESGI